MNILVISNFYPPNAVGGYERMCFEVAEALAERGAAVTVLTSNHGREVEAPPRRTVLRDLVLHADRDDIYKPFNVPPAERAAIDRNNATAFRRAVEEARPDVIFVWNLHFLGSGLVGLIQSCGVPAVFFLTDNWLITAQAPEWFDAFFQQCVRGAQVFMPPEHPRRALPIDAFAVFGSDFMRELYRAAGFAFADEAVVHNGVHLTPKLRAAPPPRGALRSPGEFKLLFAGRVVEIKGVRDAVQALARVKTMAPPDLRVSLTIVGDTQDAAFNAALAGEILALDVQDQVRFQAPVAESALPALFDAYDAYLFPSHYEPFSLTLIHALHAGIPTIASAIGGNTEIVMHGRTGMLFAKGDIDDFAAQVLRLMLDPDLRRLVSGRGRTLAARFTFERMLERLETILAAVVGGGPSLSEASQ